LLFVFNAVLWIGFLLADHSVVIKAELHFFARPVGGNGIIDIAANNAFRDIDIREQV